jgi:hypothetical protein
MLNVSFGMDEPRSCCGVEIVAASFAMAAPR